MLTSVVALCLAGGAMSAPDEDRLNALEALIRQQDERIADLERQLEERGASSPAPIAAPVSQAIAVNASPAPAAQRTPESPVLASPQTGLAVSGDLRLRQEFNWGEADGADRSRNALRARLAARYALADNVELGARLATGDLDDPNTADVTLSNFDDDLQVSLDQAYARIGVGSMQLFAGKFPNFLKRTDLVWDGDVNPQGLGAVMETRIGNGVKLAARGLYFIIDENVAGKGSGMIGGQLGVTVAPVPDLSIAFDGSYYRYDLGYLGDADNGDFRSNRVGEDGRYLSDFKLAEGIVTLRYAGLGTQWPVSATFDFVKNLGAFDGQDTAYMGEIGIGAASNRGDMHFSYGYAVAETDAVFAAFSHDNLALATDYELHMGTASYTLSPHLRLEALLYHYRPKADTVGAATRDWRDRARFNFVAEF